MTAAIIVLNAGSSSIKFAAYEADRLDLLFRGAVDGLGSGPARFKVSGVMAGRFSAAGPPPAAHDAAIAQLQDSLAPIVPGGNNSWVGSVYNPITRRTVQVNNPVVGANEIVVYVAAANLLFCSQARSEAPKFPAGMQTMTSKADLVKLLDDALTYCDGAYAATTDENFGTVLKVMGQKPSQAARGAILFFNTTHNNEHYGNMVVYMRLKGHVPPSTARSAAPAK